MNLYLLTGASAAAALVILGFLIAKLAARAKRSELSTDLLSDFSIEAYRPMERLLNEADYTFLAQQAGFQPSIEKALRAKRRQIFRAYLWEMVSDFNSLIGLAKFILVHAPQDRPEFAVAITRIQIEFYWNVFMTEVRLSLSPLVDIKTSPSTLISMLDRVWTGVQETNSAIRRSGLRVVSTDF